MAKQQSEIKGFERKSIPALDKVIVKMIEANEDQVEAKNEYSSQREKAHALFVAAKEKGEITGSTYRYGDGERVWDIELKRPDEQLTYRRVKTED